MMGLFGGLFDRNLDGKLDHMEQAMDFGTFAAMTDAIAKEDKTELEKSGLDAGELECMDAEERRKTLEDAGLDPDDYDF